MTYLFRGLREEATTLRALLIELDERRNADKKGSDKVQEATNTKMEEVTGKALLKDQHTVKALESGDQSMVLDANQAALGIYFQTVGGPNTPYEAGIKVFKGSDKIYYDGLQHTFTNDVLIERDLVVLRNVQLKGELNVTGKICWEDVCLDRRDMITLKRSSLPGYTPSNPAKSASEIREKSPSAVSGIYYYKPTGYDGDPVALFTDFTHDGGGWVVVAKWGGNAKSEDKLFTTQAIDTPPQSLTWPNFADPIVVARPSRIFLNALWRASKHIVRVHLNAIDQPAVNGIYFQKKLTQTNSFDFWKGAYSPLYWSDDQSNNYQAVGGGKTYQVTMARQVKDPSWSEYTSVDKNIYNPDTNEIVGGTGFNANMAWWKLRDVQVPHFGNLKVAQNMGYAVNISGDFQWLLTSDPTNDLFKVNENRSSVVFLRC
jgi:hypothetical protein